MRYMRVTFFMLAVCCLSCFGQSVTPNLGLTLPTQGAPNWGVTINTDLSLIDTFAGTTAIFPSSGTGVVVNTSATASRVATFSDIVGLWTSCTSGFLEFNGTCEAPINPGLSSFTSGTLSPLFTTSLGANPTTAPALTFTLTPAAANTVFGNFTGSAATPTFSSSPVFSAASLTNFPTFNQNTTGNAGTATALAATPTLCTVPNQFPTGILANGNATGCAAPAVPSGGLTSVGLSTPAYFTVTGSPLIANGTIAISATTGLAANQFLATPDGTTGALDVRSIVPDDLPLGTASTVGAVSVDNVSIKVSGAGQISATPTLGGTLSNTNASLGSGAGTGGTVTLTGLDGTHQLIIVPGTSPSTSASLVTVTYTATRGHVSYCTISPSNSATTLLNPATTVFMSANSATAYTITTGTSALTAAISYQWNISCP